MEARASLFLKGRFGGPLLRGGGFYFGGTSNINDATVSKPNPWNPRMFFDKSRKIPRNQDISWFWLIIQPCFVTQRNNEPIAQQRAYNATTYNTRRLGFRCCVCSFRFTLINGKRTLCHPSLCPQHLFRQRAAAKLCVVGQTLPQALTQGVKMSKSV